MNYLQAENLKHKRTFAKKLLLLAPIITALMNIFAPIWFQLNSYNWWYILLYPGFLTLLCALVEQRDNGKLKYYTIYTLPVSLSKVWRAKIEVIEIYVLIGNFVFLILNLLGGFAIKIVHELPLSIGVLQAAAGTFCIFIVSLWEVPFCLWLSKKIGIFLTVVLNVGIGSILGIFMATSAFWLFCPYSWVPHLMISVLGIMPNGEPVTIQGTPASWLMSCITVLLSFTLFVFLSFLTAKQFEKQEVK